MGQSIALVLLGVLLGVVGSWVVMRQKDEPEPEQEDTTKSKDDSIKILLRYIAVHTAPGEEISNELRDIYLTAIDSVSHDLLSHREEQIFYCLHDFISILPARYLGVYFECRYLDTYNQ